MQYASKNKRRQVNKNLSIEKREYRDKIEGNKTRMDACCHGDAL